MKILCFFAHPDDETMLCGGTLALLHKMGAQIHYLCATRGEGGKSGNPALCPPQELGKLRSQELRCAIDALGGGSLEFLPYVDPRVGPEDTLYPFTENINELVSRIVNILETDKPDAIITHGSNGEYGHPAHILCHKAMKQAIERLTSVKPLFYTFQAAHPNHPKPRIMNQDDPAHLVINVENVLDQKIAATTVPPHPARPFRSPPIPGCRSPGNNSGNRAFL